MQTVPYPIYTHCSIIQYEMIFKIGKWRVSNIECDGGSIAVFYSGVGKN